MSFSFQNWISNPATPIPPGPLPPGPPGPPTGVSRQIEIDFGAMPVEQLDFIIIDAEAFPTSIITGSVAYLPPSGKGLDEVELDDLSLRFGAGAGQFSINARGQTGLVSGKFKINYLIS